MPGPSSGPDIFDVRKIRRLVELMQEHDLAEIDLRQGETRIQLRRGGVPLPPAPAPAQAAAAPAAAEPAKAAAGDASGQTPGEDQVAVIRSPMVGTFYAAPDPESPPFVKVGDPVGPETTVCIVEAMKVFNEIPAEVAGKIVAVLVENGEPVEFGQPMFKVDTRK
jgi:acetyl-CoA carboxylase biotin carboxyl carrier protein